MTHHVDIELDDGSGELIPQSPLPFVPRIGEIVGVYGKPVTERYVVTAVEHSFRVDGQCVVGHYVWIQAKLAD